MNAQRTGQLDVDAAPLFMTRRQNRIGELMGLLPDGDTGPLDPRRNSIHRHDSASSIARRRMRATTTRHRIKGKLTLAIQPNKPQNRVFLLVGIVLAAAAAAAVLFAISGTVSKNNVPTANVVVAKTSIAAGTVDHRRPAHHRAARAGQLPRRHASPTPARRWARSPR